MIITFYGAAGEVTGSKHLVELAGSRILLDCGLHQGHHEEGQDKNSLKFEAVSIDAVIVSHAHLDHVGMLPILVKQGYKGKIYATGATRDLAELIMLDAAKIQHQDSLYAQKHGWPVREPLYVEEDIPAVMERFERVPYQLDRPGWFQVTPTVGVKLYDAGHILGSSVVVLQGLEGGAEQRLVFTGDLGRHDAPLLRDPDTIPDSAATLITETTYGTRLHHPVASVERTLIDVVHHVVQEKSKIVVPAFSLGRTQELVYILHQLTDQGKIPRIPIYVDSPLAERITQVFMKHQQDYDLRVKGDFAKPNENPLAFSNLHYTHSVEESKALNSLGGPCMIISASGMVTAGRVIHHLRNTLAYPNNVVLMTGYQANHTLGRQLISGAHSLHMFGEDVPVRAQIVSVNDLSAHADGKELQNFAEGIQGLKNVFLVHGEQDRAEGMRKQLMADHPDWVVTIPSPGNPYTING